MKKRKFKKSTKEEKKILYAKPESNLGLGWGDPEDDYRTVVTKDGPPSRQKKKSVYT